MNLSKGKDLPLMKIGTTFCPPVFFSNGITFEDGYWQVDIEQKKPVTAYRAFKEWECTTRVDQKNVLKRKARELVSIFLGPHSSSTLCSYVNTSTSRRRKISRIGLVQYLPIAFANLHRQFGSTPRWCNASGSGAKSFGSEKKLWKRRRNPMILEVLLLIFMLFQYGTVNAIKHYSSKTWHFSCLQEARRSILRAGAGISRDQSRVSKLPNQRCRQLVYRRQVE